MKCKKDPVNSISNLFYFIMGRVPANFVFNQDHLLLIKIYFSFKNMRVICWSRNISFYVKQ